MKILAIDDELLTTFTIERKLSLHNHNIKTANNGAEGIAKFDSFGPDLVILDCNMPKANGLDVLKHIRYKRGSSVPVLMLSGTHDEVQIKNSYTLGITGFLTKPLDLNELVAKVAAIAKANPGIGPTNLAVG